MPTQKPLTQLVPEITVYIEQRFENSIVYAREQLDIFNGDVKNYVEQSIRKEILSQKSLGVMLERIIPINILKQEVNKISKVYVDGARREAGEDKDQEMVDYYSKHMALDSVLGFSNKMYNLHNYVGIEPYLDFDKTPKLRVLDASRFLPYSDDPLDPDRMTVAIKWISTYEKVSQTIDDQGVKLDAAQDVIRNVKIYYLYSDTEFLIIDGEGDVMYDLMEKAGNPEGQHSLGMIPIIHIKSTGDLVPQQDTSMRDITVSVSKKLTDLSFATLYQSHSMFYGIDVDVSNLDSNPDAFLDIKSDPSDPTSNKSPQIGMLQPKVNIPETLQLIEAEVAMHLQSVGLNVANGEAGNSVQQAASGISKMIEEASAVQLVREQRQLYKTAEEAGLWKLLSILNNIWVTNHLVDFNKIVSSTMTVTVSFDEKKPSESETSIIEREILKLDAGLTSKRRAVRMTNPDIAADADQISALLLEIEEEELIELPQITEE